MVVAKNNNKASVNGTDAKENLTPNVNGASTTENGLPGEKEASENTDETANLPVHIKSLTIDEKLQKFNELEQLKERREDVLDALQNLKDFYISPSGDASVQMTDSRKKTLRVSHPLAIEAMITSAKTRMESELETIEAKFVI